MILRSPKNLLVLIGLLLISSFVHLSAQNRESDTENPFDGGKIKNAAGGPPGIDCHYIDLNPNGFNFNIIIENIEDNRFPCDLHVGITNPFGSTTYIELSIDLFSPIGLGNDLNLFEANFFGGELTNSELDLFECIRGKAKVPFYLNLYCKEGNEYIPIDYCADYDLFAPFFGNIIPEGQCSIAGTVVLDFCCEINDDNGPDQEGHIGGRRSNQDHNLETSFIMTNNDLEISAQNGLITNIYISNVSGQIIHAKKLSKGTNRYGMSLSQFQSGIYFVTYHLSDIIYGRSDTILREKIFIR